MVEWRLWGINLKKVRTKKIKRKTVILVLFCLLFVNCTICLGTATTLNVGSGQTYSTDGINDQIEINKALNAAQSGDTVYLHKGIYTISAPINILKSGMIFKGDGSKNTIIAASSYNAFLGSNYGDDTRSLIQLKGVSGVTMSGFMLKGVLPQREPEDRSENGILVYHSMGLEFQDIYFTQLSDDGMRIYCDTSRTDNNTVSDCIFNTVDHDCLQMWDARNWNISNCTMNVKSNSGIRIVNCQNCVVNHNTFYAEEKNSGNGGVQLQGALKSILIEWNVFHDMMCGGEGIGIYEDEDGASGSVAANNNVFYNCPGGSIVTNYIAVKGSNNVYTTKVFDWTSQGYGANAIPKGTSTNSSKIHQIKPIANFKSNIIFGKAPLTVKFTDKSTKSPTSWSWNFGDKSTSTKQNPVHKYGKAGKYTVSLTAKNTVGSNTKTRTYYITVRK
jgi:parallel beta-helix repeat protein